MRCSFRGFARAPLALSAIGLFALPLTFIGGATAAIVAKLPFFGRLTDLFETGDVAPLVMSLLVGSFANVVTLVIVTAATSWVLGELSAGRTPTLGQVARAVADRGLTLAQAFGRSAIIVIGLFFTVVGIPFSIRQLVRYQFIPQTIMLEGTDGRSALRRSSELIKPRWWHTAVVVAVIDLVLAVGFSAIGLIVLILFRPPFWLLTVVMGAASMLVFPLAAIATTLLYGDAVQQNNEAATSEEIERSATGTRMG